MTSTKPINNASKNVSERTHDSGRTTATHARRLGLAATALTALVTVGVIVKHKDSVDAAKDRATMVRQMDESPKVIEAAFREDEKVKENETPNEAYLRRLYVKIPKNVMPALVDDLKSKEVDTDGKYVGPQAMTGYPLPVGVLGLEINPDYAGNVMPRKDLTDVQASQQ